MTGYPPAKKIFDKTVALALLVCLSPVFAVVVVAMAVDIAVCPDDRGRLLYRERRVSHGSEFDLFKFRTLRREILDGMGASDHARMLEADASNLTWAGRRVLKPWYLDELPQLWNVLRGDMSLVGPRPWPRSMVRDQVARGLTYRDEFVAGWTGPAQVEKGVTEPAGYAELDVRYVDTCRNSNSWQIVRGDVAVLWRTLRVLVKGEGLRF